MLGFLEKLTLTPHEIESKDVLPLKAAGLSDEAIEDAVTICAFFCIINCCADAFQFHVPDPETFARNADNLLQHGYAR